MTEELDEPPELLSIIKQAKDKEQDARIFQQWCVQLPWMAMGGSYTSYKEYKDNLTGANIDTRPTAELLADLDAAEAELRKETNNNGARNIQAGGLDIRR